MTEKSQQTLLINVKIVPNSSKNDIIIEDNSIKVKVTAQPVENKANKALVEVVAKKLKVPKTKITIVRGLTSKEKTLSIEVSDETKLDEIKKILNL